MPLNVGDFLAAAVNPEEVDTFALMGYEPTPRQQIFHDASWARVDRIFYGGSVGGGKSCAALMDAIRFAANYPKIRIGMHRKSYPELDKSFIRELGKWDFAKKLAPLWNGVPPKWNKTAKILSFPNVSVIEFMYAETVADVTKIQGGEYQIFYFDEAALNDPRVVQQLEERLRTGSRLVPVVGARYACVDYGDVLTESGWKPIQDVAVDEMVYSVDSDGEMELRPVLETFKYDFSGDLVRIHGKGLRASFTPNHKLVTLARTRDKDSRKYTQFQWDQNTNKAVHIARAPRQFSGSGYISPLADFDTDLYLAYLGFFLAEGSTNSKPRRSNYKIVVTQCTPHKRPVVIELMSKMPVKVHALANGDFQMTNQRLWEHFRQFGKAHEKFIPRDILRSATREQLQLLFDWMMRGDGHIVPGGPEYKGGFTYTTVSPQLSDDVQELALKLGWKVSVTRSVLDNPNHRDRYTVYLTRGASPTTMVDLSPGRSHTENEHYDGPVYCINVDVNHNFVIRQNGSIWISGNSNPGGQAHQYFKDNFIKPTDYGRHTFEYLPDGATEALTHMFIPAKLSDNPYVNSEYIHALNAIPDPQRRAAMRDGDWDATAGQFFTQWSRARHVIPKEDTFPIPLDWQRYAGIDYGIHDAWAVLWIALDNNARMWGYREYCLPDVMAPQQAQLILAAEIAAKETSVVHVADSSMWGQRGTPYSIADIYGLEGVGLLKANNDRVIGWSLCHERLNEGPICEYHQHKQSLGLWHEDTCPMFHVFESACPKFIETVPTLPRDDIRPDDAKTRNVEDHMADAWRYVNMYAGHYARPVIYEDYTPPTAQEIFERMNARPAVDHSKPMKFGMSSEDFHFPADLNIPSSRGGW